MLTNIFCKHEYEFNTKIRFAINPPIVRGVCKKCGKVITISYEEYRKKYMTHRPEGEKNDIKRVD